MPAIRVEEVLAHLRPRIEQALDDLAKQMDALDANDKADKHELFDMFRESVRKRCSYWERVPDRCVLEDD